MNFIPNKHELYLINSGISRREREREKEREKERERKREREKEREYREKRECVAGTRE